MYVNIEIIVNMENKKFLSTVETAEFLGVSRATILNKIKSGDIKAEKVGQSYIIRTSYLSKKEKTNKDIVKFVVKKAIEEYGEALKMLGKE